ncbi:hypothetical protein HK098_004402 [Nowakowskiella sp. JEL0407]|nr:hypothetical protein HK098_004402 [Nowakowskiella sp. JEL0407]
MIHPPPITSSLRYYYDLLELESLASQVLSLYSYCNCPVCCLTTNCLPGPIAEAFQNLVDLAGTREFATLFSKLQQYVKWIYEEIDVSEKQWFNRMLGDCGLGGFGMNGMVCWELDAGVVCSMGLGDARWSLDSGYKIYKATSQYFEADS